MSVENNTEVIAAISTPEIDKMHAVKERSQAIGEFIEWLQNERHWIIAEWGEYKRLWPANFSIEKLLAEYFEIDLDKVEAEKRALLESLRRGES